MAVKKLVVVVDGTASMEPYWNIILEDYLKKIIRHFCRNGSIGQDKSGTIAELALVQYHARGRNSAVRAAQPNGWTRDMDTFFRWLSDLKFDGSTSDNAAIAAGLADALVMFLMHPNEDQEQSYFQGQKHCILVAFGNPNIGFMDLPVTEYPSREISAADKETDAESFAKLFIQFMVSMSVISPRQLPMLRKIFKAGNHDSNALDPFFNNVKNTEFLVLLSEKFLEAHAALKENETTEIDLGLSEEDILLLEQVLQPSPTSQLSMIDEIFSNETIEGESKTTSFSELQSENPQDCYVPVSPYIPPYVLAQCYSKSIPSLDADDLASQEMVFNKNKNAPMAIVLSQRARPFSSAIVNPSIVVSHKTQSFQEMSSVSETGERSGENQTMFSKYENYETTWPSILDSESHTGNQKFPQNPTGSLLFVASNSNLPGNLMGIKTLGLQTTGKRKQGPLQSLVPERVSCDAFSPSRSLFPSAAHNLYGSFKSPRTASYQTMYSARQNPFAMMPTPRVKPDAFPGMPQLVQNTSPCFTTTGCKVYGGSGVPQQFTTHQNPMGYDYSQPTAREGYFAGAQMQQEGLGYKWNSMRGFSQPSLSGALVSTALSEMPQEEDEGMESVIKVDALNNNLHGRYRYVRAWEGALTALMGGRLITISGAVAYRATATSYQITASWPRTLQLGRLLCQDFFEKFPKQGPKYYLIFEATNNHSVLDHLRTRKLCSNVKLPSQTMIFSPTKKERCFIATVFPGDYPIYRSKVHNLQHSQALQQQQNEQQQQQEGQKTKKKVALL